MADPPTVLTPDEPSLTPNGTYKMTLPTVLCHDTSMDAPDSPKTKSFISSESKLSLPSNLGTPTSPLRLSSPLSLPASPTPFRLGGSPQPPPSPKSLGRSRQSSLTKSTEEEAASRAGSPAQTLVNSGSATGNPRNKCALQPGHSLMDWIRLGNSGKDLTGVGGRIRPVAPKELAAHNTKGDAWLAIRGRVYNITHYLPFHPGGAEELLRGAGMDATQLFDKVHPWVNYDSLLAKCLVGPLSIDRPDAGEFFGSPNPSHKSDTLKEPSKAQELVRKSMENLANCITPVRKKIQSKTEDSGRSMSNTSRIMQSLIQSSDLPLTISRRAGSSPVRSKSTSSDDTRAPDTPAPLRFDWIQTSAKLTISIYTGPLANPGCFARLTEGALLVEITTNGWLRTLKIVPEAKLKEPLQLKVYAESGKVEVTAQKSEPAVWKGCGDAAASNAIQAPSPRMLQCRVKSIGRVTHDTVMLSLSPEEGPIVVPLGHHVRIHRQINGSECVRSYTPIGEGWSPADGDGGASIKLAVKRYSRGALSQHLTGALDELAMSASAGNYELAMLKGVTKVFFIAAGTGITPMLGLIKFMLSRTNPRCEKLHLLFFNKKEEDILFHENFDEIAKGDRRFTATYILSEPSNTWTGPTGRISLVLLKDVLGKDCETCTEQCKHAAYVCGPTEFTHSGLDMLNKMGLHDNCVHAFMG